jgi:hypothetical protein
MRLMILLVAFTLTIAPARQSDEVESILRLARTAVSETTRIERVDAIAVDMRRVWENGNADAVVFTLVLPDRFQARTGRVTHTIAGPSFWQSVDNPPQLQEVAHRTTRDRAARMTILFLLRTPDFLPLRTAVRKSQPFAGRRALAVQFTAEAFDLTLFVDAETHLPLGFESAAPIGSPGGAQETAAHRGLLLAYGTVDGVRFPSRIEETIGEFPSVTFVDRIEVNPIGVDELFRRDG